MNLSIEAPPVAWAQAANARRLFAQRPLLDDAAPPAGLSPQRFAHLLEEVEALLFAVRKPSSEPVEGERALLTLMFTDIVDSSGHAQRLGDEAWSRLLERHHAIVRAQLATWRGCELDTAGDGFFASFDTPTRAMRCALAIRGALQALGIEIRVGLHTGECERLANKVAGLAVHVAARIAARAAAGEIMVSGTVRDLVMGSGLCFAGGECHALKGLCEPWRLYRVCGDEVARSAQPGDGMRLRH